ncbi:11863_t:CDS:2 [Funneliformis geosporum]|uniref:12733_t:CDS:1 n=1 Tax=Funneliformis geosporum TaxID=1117311 RepID=A0A9W4X1H1_9GLOM|nr:11863_t:CDS:2 [Funneliformis geosporum]CAI2179422.1 12733_t:CDS:2 [Funneliformis geosporum]
MEQPSVTFTATQSVDYLGQSHKWTESEVMSSYKEISKQLKTVQEKLREEREQKLLRSRTKKGSSRSAQLAQKISQVPAKSQQPPRGKNDAIIGNISRQLKQQKDECALRAEEKRLIRMKNALWRRMGPTVGCVGKGNKLVSPKTLKWQKECDILWLFGPLYQPDNDPFMEDDDDKTLVGSPPATCCPPSPMLSPLSSLSSSPSSPSIYIKPALKKTVEHDPLKDLISYACEVLANEKSYSGRRYTTPLPIKPKKSIRFSRNLEQVHYTPTHYTMRPPPTRRRMSNPFFVKMEEDLSNGKNVEQYDQIFAWAKEQVKSTGKVQLFGEDGAWLGGNHDDDDDEFVMPPLPPLVKSRRSPSSSPRSPNRRSSATPPAAYTAAAAKKKTSAYSKNNFVDSRYMSSHVAVDGDSETAESGVVQRCVNVASNVKDVVSWCGSMLWNSTVF